MDPGITDDPLVGDNGNPDFTPIGGDTDVPVSTDDLVHTDQDRSLTDAAEVLDSSRS